jgi:hypothetical protein
MRTTGGRRIDVGRKDRDGNFGCETKDQSSQQQASAAAKKENARVFQPGHRSSQFNLNQQSSVFWRSHSVRCLVKLFHSSVFILT